MKKFIKNNVLGFILGLIVMGSISTIAYSYSAKQVGFTPNDKDWKVDNIESAINDLKLNSKLAFGTPSYNQSLGDIITSRSTSVSLKKGKYLIVTTINKGLVNSSSSVSEEVFDYILNITCSSCKKTALSGRYYHNIPPYTNNSYTPSGKKVHTQLSVSAHYVEVTADTDVISITGETSWSANALPELVAIQAIPINN